MFTGACSELHQTSKIEPFEIVGVHIMEAVIHRFSNSKDQNLLEYDSIYLHQVLYKV